jgi:hypothetical protein
MHHTSVTLADLSFPLFSIFEIIKHGWLKNCCHVFIVYYLYNLVKIRCLLYLSLYTNDIPHGVISGFIFSINQSVMSLPNLEVLKLNRNVTEVWCIYCKEIWFKVYGEIEIYFLFNVISGIYLLWKWYEKYVAKPAHAVTSIKMSPVLKVHFFFVPKLTS